MAPFWKAWIMFSKTTVLWGGKEDEKRNGALFLASNEAWIEHFLIRADRITKCPKLAIFGISSLAAPKHKD